MKFIDNEYYEVKSTDGLHGLAERFATKEEAIKRGKIMNENEKKLGYNESAWIITKTKWSKCLDDDGTFISENSSTIALSI